MDLMGILTVVSMTATNSTGSITVSSVLSNPLVELALIFIDGLLFGLGIKKGVWSVILIVIAVFLSEYINFSVLPKASLSTFYDDVKSHIEYIITNINKIIPFSNIGAISISLILFIVGFIVGYMKG
ncbi:hypothetical protein [Cuniculiplasma divulgatum]|jgi:hypothetical protein|uniref:Membrane protein n=1 Tax=Cuniculiplasma divulgatum TaxID=1673428 RepID=A0A1N5UG83_9ARCH|nr:hypothetical protein [Cuniculiplasma divulgatum]EQB69931.1 MAG: hypothetical protein AMDU5_GPLC00001G0149 [Thermoplasmatales archaeon Gpl]MCI2411861.1 hypothetical protein [Cuniculiplasma sp.]MCL6014262.1 hypothetical protein [Candidatus Thermoplasmatota archaeon]WMT49049.1 MAG: hypothetical protein RE472_08240 [Thermoplasmatales archaeon]SIM59195.1 membrane protein [Cuniculiplasma divulgatum]